MWWPIIGNKFILFYSISLHKYEFSPFLMQFQNAGGQLVWYPTPSLSFSVNNGCRFDDGNQASGQFQKDEKRSENFGYAL